MPLGYSKIVSHIKKFAKYVGNQGLHGQVYAPKIVPRNARSGRMQAVDIVLTI